MAIYEFHIALRADNEGDIVNVQKPGLEIGRKALDGFLIVPVSIGLAISYNALVQRMKSLYMTDGHVRDLTFRDIDYVRDGIDEGTYPNHLFVLDMKTNLPISRPTMLAKKRWKIPLSELGDIDKVQTKNRSVIYQPFIKGSRIVAQYPALNPDSDYVAEYKGGAWKITKKTEKFTSTLVAKDVEYQIYDSTPSIDPDDEKLWTWQIAELVFDKHADGLTSPLEVSQIGL